MLRCVSVCLHVVTIPTMKIPPNRAAMNLLRRAAHRLATWTKGPWERWWREIRMLAGRIRPRVWCTQVQGHYSKTIKHCSESDSNNFITPQMGNAGVISSKSILYFSSHDLSETLRSRIIISSWQETSKKLSSSPSCAVSHSPEDTDEDIRKEMKEELKPLPPSPEASHCPRRRSDRWLWPRTS